MKLVTPQNKILKALLWGITVIAGAVSVYLVGYSLHYGMELRSRTGGECTFKAIACDANMNLIFLLAVFGYIVLVALLCGLVYLAAVYMAHRRASK